MKLKLFFTLLLVTVFMVACGDTDNGGDDTTDDTDVVTASSQVADEESIQTAASEDGTWIIIATEDITLSDELVVEGTFYNRDDEDADLYRKIAAYDQDDEQNITDQYTIETSRLVVQSENVNFQGGTLAGDIYVEADGFQLHETSTVTGDIIFANEDFEASADISGTVEGEVSVE